MSPVAPCCPLRSQLLPRSPSLLWEGRLHVIILLALQSLEIGYQRIRASALLRRELSPASNFLLLAKFRINLVFGAPAPRPGAEVHLHRCSLVPQPCRSC